MSNKFQSQSNALLNLMLKAQSTNDKLDTLNTSVVNNIQGDIDSINTTLASGVAIKGNDAGTPTLIKCDANGVVSVSNVASQNIIPANNSNSHITDDPANSLAVGIKGRTTIGTATTETFLRCSDTGASIQMKKCLHPKYLTRV